MNLRRMKERIPYLLVLFALALCLWGCGKSAQASYPPTLVEAARLSEYEAERALPLLEALADSLDRLDEEGRVYYDLLRVRVNDKLNIRATSDSLIRRVTAFYERYGDPDKLTLAYYYRGRVCSDLNDALQAVEYYRKAIEASKGTKQYLLLSKIYSQLGEALEYQNIYEEAIPYYRKAYDYTLLSKDSVTLSLPIRDIAAIYNALGKNDSALIYYKKAYETAIITRNRPRALEILVEMSAAYRDLGDFPNAFAPLFVSLEDSVDRNMNPTYYSLGKLYLLTGKLDSADYWMNRVRLGDDVYIDSEVYNYLGQIKLLRKDYERSAYYYSLYQQRQDSIAKMGNASDLYQVKEAHEAVNRQAVDTRRWLLAGTVVLALLVALGYSYYCYRTNRRRLERQILYLRQMEERLKDELKEGINQDQDFRRKRNQEIIDRLTHDLAAVQKQLEQETAKWRTKYAKAQELAKSYKKELRQYADGPLAERRPFEEVLDQLRKEPRVLSEQERQELRLFMDAQNNSFTVRLLEANPELKAGDLLLCCLIRLGFSGKSLATLLAINLNSVTKQKQRLRGRLVQKPANDAELTDYIRNF